MLVLERNGVHVDVCPECKGIWLDPGELNKILDYAIAEHVRASKPLQGSAAHGPAHGAVHDWKAPRADANDVLVPFVASAAAVNVVMEWFD
jgi:Zn-finger nucleic acid-binding protein